MAMYLIGSEREVVGEVKGLGWRKGTWKGRVEGREE